jgi:hypothetical protein
MIQKGRFIQVYVPDKEDNRKKSYRIIDSLKGITSQGQFYVIPSQHTDFIEQYTNYPAVIDDDVIEAVAEATRIAQEDMTLAGVAHRYDDELEDDSDRPVKVRGGCP